MPPDDFREGVLSVPVSVAREQFPVGVAHVWKYIGADLRNRTKILCIGPGYLGDMRISIHLQQSARFGPRYGPPCRREQPHQIWRGVRDPSAHAAVGGAGGVFCPDFLRDRVGGRRVVIER
jgi:hypothetical protein